MSSSINLSGELYKKLEEKVEKSEEFNSVDDYAAYVLDEVMKKTDGGDSEKLSKEDEEKVKERLKGLGYLE